MDVPVGKFRPAQIVLPDDLLGEQVRELPGTPVHAVFRRGHQHLLGQARRGTVHRHNPAGDPALALLFRHGIRQGLAPAHGADLAVKGVALPHMQLIFHIGLVEIGDLRRAGVVHNPEFHQFHAPAHPVQPRFIGHHGPDTAGVPFPQVADGHQHGTVVIPPGEIPGHIPEGADAQFPEGRRFLLPHPGQGGDLRIPDVHLRASLRGCQSVNTMVYRSPLAVKASRRPSVRTTRPSVVTRSSSKPPQVRQ